MAEVHVPRIYLSGPHRNAGVNTIALGLIQPLQRLGVSVSLCVIGARLQLATILGRLARREVPVLDPRVLSHDQQLDLLRETGSGADLLVCVGESGLHDLAPDKVADHQESRMIARSESPVVFCFPVRAYRESLLASIQGFRSYDSKVSIEGVLLNDIPGSLQKGEVFGDEVERLLAESLLLTPLGGVPHIASPPQLPDRRISEEQNQTSLSIAELQHLEDTLRDTLHFEALLRIARGAAPLGVPLQDVSPPSQGRRVKIAVANDSALFLCQQDNLTQLKQWGAVLAPFSPLTDKKLPEGVGGLYLTGGGLAGNGADLSRNTSLMTDIRQFAEAGGALYAEGSGCALLCSSFEEPESDAAQNGVGLLEGHAQFSPSTVEQRAAEVVDTTLTEGTILGPAGEELSGYHGYEWSLAESHSIIKTLRVTNRHQQTSTFEGYSPTSNSLATFGFLTFRTNSNVAREFVEAATVFRPLG